MSTATGFRAACGLLLLGAVLGLGPNRALAIDTLADYEKNPAFITSPVQPLTMLLLDNTGSMASNAYTGTYPTSGTIPTYYGYFESDKYYYHPFAQAATKVCDYTGISGSCTKVTGTKGDCTYPQRNCVTTDTYYTCYRAASTSGPYASNAACTSACAGGTCTTASHTCDTAAVPASYSPLNGGNQILYDPLNDTSKIVAASCDGSDNNTNSDCSSGYACTAAYGCYNGSNVLQTAKGYFGNSTCDNGSGNVCTAAGFTCKAMKSTKAGAPSINLCYKAGTPASSVGPTAGACVAGSCTSPATCTAASFTCTVNAGSDGIAYKNSDICDKNLPVGTDCTNGMTCTAAYRCIGSTTNYGTSNCDGACTAALCKAYTGTSSTDWSGKDCATCAGSCADTGVTLAVANSTPPYNNCTAPATWCNSYSGATCVDKDVTSTCSWTDWVAMATCKAGGGTCIDNPEVPDMQGACTSATELSDCTTKYLGVCNTTYSDTTTRASYWEKTPTTPTAGGSYTDTNPTAAAVTLGNKLNFTYTTQMDAAKKALIGGKRGVSPVPPQVYLDGDKADILLQPGEDPKGILQNYEGLAWGFGVLNAPNGGIIKNPVGSPNADIVQAINDTPSSGNTDLAESLNTVVNYFRQTSQEYYGKYYCGGSPLPGVMYPNPWCDNTVHTSTKCLNGNSCTQDNTVEYSISTAWDPFFDKPSQSYTPCGRASVILITDGEPNQDDVFNSTVKNYANGNPSGITDFIVPNASYTCATGGGTYSVSYCNNTNHALTTCLNGSNCNVTTTTNTYYLDDVAYWAHTHDLRTEAAMGGDTGMNGQKLDVYMIYAFGNDATMMANMQKAAVLGGFIDKDGNGKPNTVAQEAAASDDMKEWDFNKDGIADNFANASQGDQLAVTLQNMLGQIQQKAAAGSAASVISASRTGEGAIYQAVFYAKTPPDDGLPLVNGLATPRSVVWVGDVHALWVDDFGNMREDCESGDNPNDGTCSGSNGILDRQADKILEFYSDPTSGEAMVRTFKDVNGDMQYISGTCSVDITKNGKTVLADTYTNAGTLPAVINTDIKEFDCTSKGGNWSPQGSAAHPNPDFVASNTLRSFSHYIWSAGQQLAQVTVDEDELNRDYASTSPTRYIFTYKDGAPGGRVPFTNAELKSNFGSYYFNYLNAANPTEADHIINFIRGFADYSDPASTKYQGYRSRQYDWGWGAGVQTNRLGDVIGSTPTVVSRPAENYDDIYSDNSYLRFRQRHDKRRIMVYAGANDGGLHAFNGGYYDRTNGKFLDAPPKRPITGNPVTQTYYSHYPLGSEMWMYIPQNLLPHLKWLTASNYNHVYYVDMKPYVFDAKIFTPTDADGIHPDGWGTVLVGGMGLGGGDFTLDSNGDGVKDLTMRSSYFILDITDPENPPVVLAEFNDPNLGFTLGAPTAVPMLECNKKRFGGTCTGAYDNSDYTKTWPMKWYLAFGSGPHNDSSTNPTGIQAAMLGKSDQPAYAYVLDLGGTTVKSNPTLAPGYPKTFAVGDLTAPTNISKGYFSDMSAVDYDLDFKTDTLYFGSVANAIGTSPATTSFTGGLHRLVTWESDDPSLWTLNTMFKAEKPIVAAPTVAYDGSRAWVYFGTGRLVDITDKVVTYTCATGGGTYVNSYCNNTSQTGTTCNNGSSCVLIKQSYYGLKERYDSSNQMSLNLPNGGNLFDVSNVWVEDVTGNLYDNLTNTPAVIPLTGGSNLPSTVTTFNQLKDKIAERDSGNLDKYHGWKIDFPDAGERNLGQGSLLGGALTFTTYIPSNEACSGEGESSIWAVYFRTGTAYYKPLIGQVSRPGGKTENIRALKHLKGMTLSPSVHEGAETGSKAMIQTSTGAIISIDEKNPEVFKSGVISWRDKSAE